MKAPRERVHVTEGRAGFNIRDDELEYRLGQGHQFDGSVDPPTWTVAKVTAKPFFRRKRRRASHEEVKRRFPDHAEMLDAAHAQLMAKVRGPRDESAELARRIEDAG